MRNIVNAVPCDNTSNVRADSIRPHRCVCLFGRLYSLLRLSVFGRFVNRPYDIPYPTYILNLPLFIVSLTVPTVKDFCRTLQS